MSEWVMDGSFIGYYVVLDWGWTNTSLLDNICWYYLRFPYSHT